MAPKRRNQVGTMREKTPGVWELRVATGRDPVTNKYRQVSRTYRGKERGAANALAKLVTETNEGAAAATKGTFGHLLDEWLRVAQRDLSVTTYEEYERLVRSDIKPALGAVPLDKLTGRRLDEFYRTLGAPRSRDRTYADGTTKTVELKPMSATSITRVHAICRRSLNQAVKWDWITANPTAKATPPATRKAEIQPPAVEKMLAVFAAADENDPGLAVLLRTKLALGARRGELCGLRWDDIDLDAGVVVVRHAVVESKAKGVELADRMVEKDTKTHQARKVAIDADAVALLLEHRRRVEANATAFRVPLQLNGYVFSHQPDGSEPVQPSSISKAFKRLCVAAGLDNVRLHDLRHLNASLLLAAGVPLHTVQFRLGHANASTTSNIYGHMMPETDREAANVLGGLLGGPKALPQA